MNLHKHMRRLTAATLAVAITTLGAAGCGGGESDRTDTSDEKDAIRNQVKKDLGNGKDRVSGGMTSGGLIVAIRSQDQSLFSTPVTPENVKPGTVTIKKLEDGERSATVTLTFDTPDSTCEASALLFERKENANWHTASLAIGPCD